ncbi:MAG: hypothetical protein AABY86_07045, partial [Bdellovibrionota bacterium]
MGMFLMNWRKKLVQILLLALLITISCMITLVQGQTSENFGIDEKLKTYLVQKTFQSHVENFKNGKEWAASILKLPWNGQGVE